MAKKSRIKFDVGKRYNSWNYGNWFISITDRTTRYLTFRVYHEEKVLSYYPVYDFRRVFEGEYKTPVSSLGSEGQEMFFIVENNRRIWFRAEDVRR